jgi:hypothetical protein
VQLDKSRQRGRDRIFVRQNTNSFRNIDDRRKLRSIAPLARNRKFESISLQRRVGSKPVPTSVHAHRLDEQELANWRGGRNAVYPLGPLTLGARLALADA